MKRPDKDEREPLPCPLAKTESVSYEANQRSDPLARLEQRLSTRRLLWKHVKSRGGQHIEAPQFCRKD
jgi:hypothetical protein